MTEEQSRDLKAETERLLAIQPDGVQARHIRALQSRLDALEARIAAAPIGRVYINTVGIPTVQAPDHYTGKRVRVLVEESDG